MPVQLGNSQSWTNSSSNALTVNGSVTGMAPVGTQTLTLAATSTGGTTLSGVIADGTGGGNLALTISSSGTGLTTINGGSSNTFTGTTTLSGTSQLALSKTGGAVAISGDVLMAATGTRSILWTSQNNQFGPNTVMRWSGSGDTRFELSGTTQTLAGVDTTNFSSGGTYAAIENHEFGGGGLGSSTLILNVAGGNSFTFGNNNGNTVIRDYNNGTLSLIKNGLGTQTLGGTGITYTGGTTVNAGMLRMDLTGGSMGLGTYTIAGAGTLNLYNTAPGVDNTLIQNINLKGSGTIAKTGAGYLTLWSGSRWH